MDNPIATIEHLPKNQKVMVIGGAAAFGGLLVYRSHQKNKAALAASQSGGDPSTSSQDPNASGTGDSGTQDGSSTGIDPTTGVPYADEAGSGLSPASTDAALMDSLYGGYGSADPGAYYGNVGAGNLMGPTAAGPSGTENLNIHVTGGGAPATHPGKHAPPKRKPPIHHKTVHHHPTPTKPKRGSKPKKGRR